MERLQNNHEKGDVTQFYKDWIRDAFTEGLPFVEEMVATRNSLESGLGLGDSAGLVKYFDRGPKLVDAMQVVIAEIDAIIDGELESTVDDLQRTIFDGKLFSVSVLVRGRVFLVTGVACDRQGLLAEIEGQLVDVRDLPIDQVIFDR